MLKVALLRAIEAESDKKKRQTTELKKLIKLKKDIVTVLNQSRPYSLTHSLTYLLSHSLTHSLFHARTHSLTHSLTGSKTVRLS